MKRFTPSFCSSRALLTGIAGVAGIAPLAGQELDLRSLDDARISEKFDQRLGEKLRGTTFAPQQEGLEVSVFASLAYDDNIFRSATNVKEDLVISVSPEIRYTKGQPEGRAWMSLAYRPTAVIYVDEKDESRVDQMVSLKAAVRRKVFRLAYEGSWARLGYPDADVGGAPDRMEWDQRVVLGWDRKGKTSAEIFAEWSLEDQQAAFLNDVEAVSAGITLHYEYSPKTRLGMTYQFGEVDVDGSPTQEFQRITGRINWRPRPHIRASIEMGGEYRDFGVGGDNWEPVMAGRIGFTPVNGTELYLTGYRREEVSAFFDGQNFTVLGVAAGINQRLIGAWAARIEGGWEETEYVSTVGGAAGRKDTAVFVRPSVVYDVNDGLQLQIYYQWTENDSNNAAFGYSNNELGVSGSYLF